LRSEHSQGGAQRSEQYLYGAQRAIKSSTVDVSASFTQNRIRTLSRACAQR
jgi:hypothetical protein